MTGVEIVPEFYVCAYCDQPMRDGYCATCREIDGAVESEDWYAEQESLAESMPTAWLLGKWQQASARERNLSAAARAESGGEYDVDAYDLAADQACIMGRALAARGVALCYYCGTVPPAPHTSSTCPDRLAEILA